MRKTTNNLERIINLNSNYQSIKKKEGFKGFFQSIRNKITSSYGKIATSIGLSVASAGLLYMVDNNKNNIENIAEYIASQLSISNNAYAQTLNVAPGDQIQNIISTLNVGDELVFSAGDYNVSTLEINGKKNIKVYAQEGNLVNVVGDGTGSVLTVRNSEGVEINNIILSGAKINYPSNDIGAGINSLSSSNVLINNCSITGNDYGIVFQGKSNGTVDGCRIFKNGDGQNKYAIFTNNSSIMLMNSLIYNNQGIGFYQFNSSTPEDQDIDIINCDVVGNSEHGIYFTNPKSARIYNSIISENGGTGIVFYAAGGGVAPSISYCLVYGNTTSQFLDVSCTTKCTSGDPLFVDKANGNFYLSALSPCIDSGTTLSSILSDIDGNDRPQGKGFDIGAYEFNVNPIVEIIASEEVVPEGGYFSLTAIVTDPQGEPTQVKWGNQLSYQIIDYSALVQNLVAPEVDEDTDNIFTCTAINESGYKTERSIIISFLDVNKSPFADAGLDQIVAENTVVTIDGSGSYDPDGDSLTYLWQQVSGTTVDLSNPNSKITTFKSPYVSQAGETVVLELLVTDEEGLQYSDQVNINVNWENKAPIAVVPSVYDVNEGEQIILDGTGSHDPDGLIRSYQWIQTHGPAVEIVGSNTATARFEAPQVDDPTESNQTTLGFTLIVTDYYGIIGETDTIVNVKYFPETDKGGSGGCFIYTLKH